MGNASGGNGSRGRKARMSRKKPIAAFKTPKLSVNHQRCQSQSKGRKPNKSKLSGIKIIAPGLMTKARTILATQSSVEIIVAHSPRLDFREAVSGAASACKSLSFSLSSGCIFQLVLFLSLRPFRKIKNSCTKSGTSLELRKECLATWANSNLSKSPSPLSLKSLAR